MLIFFILNLFRLFIVLQLYDGFNPNPKLNPNPNLNLTVILILTLTLTPEKWMWFVTDSCLLGSGPCHLFRVPIVFGPSFSQRFSIKHFKDVFVTAASYDANWLTVELFVGPVLQCRLETGDSSSLPRCAPGAWIWQRGALTWRTISFSSCTSSSSIIRTRVSPVTKSQVAWGGGGCWPTKYPKMYRTACLF